VTFQKCAFFVCYRRLGCERAAAAAAAAAAVGTAR